MAGCKRIAMLSSGGDAPGMNAAIRAAALVGRSLGADIVGIERGYKGLLEDAFVPPKGDSFKSLDEDGFISYAAPDEWRGVNEEWSAFAPSSRRQTMSRDRWSLPRR